jgi:hypothetical protein
LDEELSRYVDVAVSYNLKYEPLGGVPSSLEVLLTSVTVLVPSETVDAFAEVAAPADPANARVASRAAQRVTLLELNKEVVLTLSLPFGCV